jgi:hypothetical protein
MASEGKGTIEDACKIRVWVHGDSINLDRESERIIGLGWEEEKSRDHFSTW